MEEWMQYARDMAKAEKELEIELWVIISFYRTTEQGGKVLLFRYDLPRKVADKYDWVVRWRRARLTCQYPKGNVTHTYCLYDRHSGEDYSFGSCLSSLAAAKAQVTRMERRIREYTAWQKQNNLFFDEQTDEMLQKAVAKLKIKKENVITAMGRLDEQKGFDVLINAFKEVYNRHPEYKLKIFGNGLEKNKLQELINKLGLSENVILCGANQDAIFEVAKSKIYVLSSRYEGMPNALIEAMAAGTACISTDCKFGPSELINDGKNGLLIPVDDVRTLSEKILFLIKNDSARENIEKEAMKIRKKLDANTIYKKYYDYFVGVKNEK